MWAEVINRLLVPNDTAVSLSLIFHHCITKTGDPLLSKDLPDFQAAGM